MGPRRHGRDGRGFALAQGLDLDPRLFVEAVSGGPLDLPYLHVKGQAMLDDDDPAAFSAKNDDGRRERRPSGLQGAVVYRPAALLSSSTLSSFSQVKSGSSRPKWP